MKVPIIIMKEAGFGIKRISMPRNIALGAIGGGLGGAALGAGIGAIANARERDSQKYKKGIARGGIVGALMGATLGGGALGYTTHKANKVIKGLESRYGDVSNQSIADILGMDPRDFANEMSAHADVAQNIDRADEALDATLKNKLG
jgi:hypothetical protein